MKLFRTILVFGFAILGALSSFAMESDDSEEAKYGKNILSLADLLKEEAKLVQDWNDFFAANPQLQTLKIVKSQIHGTMGLSNLAEQIVRHPNLTAIDLSHDDIGGDEWAHAIGTILKHKPNITSLDLSYNKIRGDVWIEELRDGLLCNTSLRILNLSSCKLSGLTLDNRIGDILRHNDLLVIDLSGNDSTSIFVLLIFLKGQNFSLEDIMRQLKLGFE